MPPQRVQCSIHQVHVQDVQLVCRHQREQLLDGLGRHVVPGGVQHQAPPLEAWSVLHAQLQRLPSRARRTPHMHSGRPGPEGFLCCLLCCPVSRFRAPQGIQHLQQRLQASAEPVPRARRDAAVEGRRRQRELVATLDLTSQLHHQRSKRTGKITTQIRTSN